MYTLLGLAAILTPFALVTCVAWLVQRLHDVRALRVQRQIVVTDAIHRELGAVVAPVVRKRPWGPWRLELAMPLDRPDVIEAVLRTARRALEPITGGSFEIVLLPRVAPASIRR
jgi:hypothetical protein